jgi:hypothetical protein
MGPAEVRVTKSQVAFRRGRAFAWAWMPGRYLHGNHAPLVLTLVFADRSESYCWKEIVEPTPGRYTHHLELHSASDIDDEVQGWLCEAWESAEPSERESLAGGCASGIQSAGCERGY